MITSLDAAHHAACIEVIHSLPEWFGYEGAIANITKALNEQLGFVAIVDDEVSGFVLTSPLFPETLEITYLAVHREHRHQGVGRQLISAVRNLATETGAESICLLTLGPSGESPWYAETVEFYRAVGFWRTKESRLTDWGGAPALLMSAPIQSLQFGDEAQFSD